MDARQITRNDTCETATQFLNSNLGISPASLPFLNFTFASRGVERKRLLGLLHACTGKRTGIGHTEHVYSKELWALTAAGLELEAEGSDCAAPLDRGTLTAVCRAAAMSSSVSSITC